MKQFPGTQASSAFQTFSILERIDVGETHRNEGRQRNNRPFSILERIDVGETCRNIAYAGFLADFQYPRTDRRG